MLLQEEMNLDCAYSNISLYQVLWSFVLFSVVQYLLIPIQKGGATRRHSCTITSTPGSYWTENNVCYGRFQKSWKWKKKIIFFLFTHCLNKGNNTAISDFQVWKIFSFSCHEVIVKITISRNKNVLLKKYFIFRINK